MPKRPILTDVRHVHAVNPIVHSTRPRFFLLTSPYSSGTVALGIIAANSCPRLCPTYPSQQHAQFLCNISPLVATLPGSLVCVANKGLAQYLSPLDATLTKNIGVGERYCMPVVPRLGYAPQPRPFRINRLRIAHFVSPLF